MIRFFLFILGIISGLVAAIFVLPIPGKTFFNKMSRLPTGVKSLIDDSMDLGISFWKLIIGLSDDLGIRLRESLEGAKNKTDQMREQLEANRKREQHLKDIANSDEGEIGDEIAEQIL